MNNSKRSSKRQLVQESRGQRVYVEQPKLVSMTHPRTVGEETRRKRGENEFVTVRILVLETRRLLDSLLPILSRWTRWFDEEMV